MIHRRDELLELRAQRPSDKRHERLEAAEEQRDDRRLAQVEPLHAQAFAYRHGERIHRQADRQQQQLHESHGFSSRPLAAPPGRPALHGLGIKIPACAPAA